MILDRNLTLAQSYLIKAPETQAAPLIISLLSSHLSPAAAAAHWLTVTPGNCRAKAATSSPSVWGESFLVTSSVSLLRLFAPWFWVSGSVNKVLSLAMSSVSCNSGTQIWQLCAVLRRQTSGCSDILCGDNNHFAGTRTHAVICSSIISLLHLFVLAIYLCDN